MYQVCYRGGGVCKGDEALTVELYRRWVTVDWRELQQTFGCRRLQAGCETQPQGTAYWVYGDRLVFIGS